VAEPVYVLTAPFWIWALPSMKIVPFAVRTFVVAFHESSPADPTHVYDVEGVRSWTVGMLLFRFATFGVAADPWSLSKVGGVPLCVRQG
jgi:hypothetical protein